jgi:hypothetical protein
LDQGFLSCRSQITGRSLSLGERTGRTRRHRLVSFRR